MLNSDRHEHPVPGFSAALCSDVTSARWRSTTSWPRAAEPISRRCARHAEQPLIASGTAYRPRAAPRYDQRHGSHDDVEAGDRHFEERDKQIARHWHEPQYAHGHKQHAKVQAISR